MADDVNARGLGAITRPSRERAYDQLHLPPNARPEPRDGDQGGRARRRRRRSSSAKSASTATRSPSRPARSGSTSAAPTPRSPSAATSAICSPRPESGAPARPRRDARSRPARRRRSRRSSSTSRACWPNSPRARPRFSRRRSTLDPGYDRARLALWEVRTSQGDHAAALAAARAVAPARRVARRARFLAGVSLLSLKQYDEAFTVFKTLQDAASDPAILNNLGVIQLRRAADGRHRQAGVLLHEGGGSGAGRSGPPLQSRLCLRARSRSAGGDLLAARGAPAESRGRRRALRPRRRRSTRRAARVEAGRERELAAQLSSLPVDAASARRDALPRGLERVRQHLESVRGNGHRPGDCEHGAARSARPRAVPPGARRAGCSTASRTARR